MHCWQTAIETLRGMEQASTPTMRLAALTRTVTAILAEFQDEMKARELETAKWSQSLSIDEQDGSESDFAEAEAAVAATVMTPLLSESVANPSSSSLDASDAACRSPLMSQDTEGPGKLSTSTTSGASTVPWPHARDAPHSRNETPSRSTITSTQIRSTITSIQNRRSTLGHRETVTGGYGKPSGASRVSIAASLQSAASNYLDADEFLTILIFVICRRWDLVWLCTAVLYSTLLHSTLLYSQSARL